MSDSSQTAPSRSLLRHRDFIRLWSAETISQFGTQVSLLAIPLVAINLLDATPFEVALLGTFEFLPFLLFSLPAGAWVDRLRRRPILIAGDLGRAVSLLSIPIAYELGVLTVPQLYIVGFVNGVLTVFFDVSYQSYVPSLVDRDQLIEANSKLEISRTIAQTAGPAIAGALIGFVSSALAIIADSISFFASALFVLGIRRHEPTPEKHVDEHGQPRQGLRREVADGLRYVTGNQYLRGIAASTGTSNFFTNVAFATYLVYLVRDLGLSPALIGVIFGIGNVGAVVGALTGNRWWRILGVGPTIVISMFLSGPAVIIAGGRAEGLRGAVPGRLRRADGTLGRGVQRDPGQLPAGDHAAADAGPDERDDAVHRLGHDPAGPDHRWRARRDPGCPPGPVDRGDRGEPGVGAARRDPGAQAPGDAGAGRGWPDDGYRRRGARRDVPRPPARRPSEAPRRPVGLLQPVRPDIPPDIPPCGVDDGIDLHGETGARLSGR